MAVCAGRRAAAWAGAIVGAVLGMTMVLAGCTSPGEATGSGTAPTGVSPPATTTVGTITNTVTVTSAPTTSTVTESARTVTTELDPADVPPPPSTSEPAPKHGDCPYLTNAQVMDANGQHPGQTSIIATEPYPVCLFTRADGRYLATARIVVADTPIAAAAAVNQHVPVDKSNPAKLPDGWSGGSMGNLDGVGDYPAAHSIYAVSKGTTAIIAISNQKQSIKGRIMVTDIIDNLGL